MNRTTARLERAIEEWRAAVVADVQGGNALRG
jgi:hypothetical protein